MKNIIFVLVIIACVGLIYLGVTSKSSPLAIEQPLAQQSGVTAAIPSATEPATPQTPASARVSSSVSIPTPPIIAVKNQIARPDASTLPASSAPTPGGSDNSARNFQITPDLLAKMHLVDKYKPGICFGVATPVPQVAITGMISAYPDLSAFIKDHYKLQTDLEVYNKMKQLQDVRLTEIASSRFSFSFMDGQCSAEVYYEGTVEVMTSGVVDTVTLQQAHSYK